MRLRIGFFTDSFRPYTSGVVRSIETFSKELTNMGHQVYVFAPKYPDSVPEPGVFRFVSIPSPTNREFSLAIPISLQLRHTARRLGIEVIHVHSPFLLGRMGARYARQKNLPLVCTYHTMYDQYLHYVPLSRDLSRKLVRRITHKFFNMCDVIIAPTKVIGQALVQEGVHRPVRVIPTGIELDEFIGLDRNWLRQTYGIGPNEKILLHVGRLGVEKNIELLMQTFAVVCGATSSARLVLAGDGPLLKQLREMAAGMHLEDRVIFTGKMAREGVLRCYAGADLFVFASLTETQGLVLGEAKAAGLPVVAVRAMGASEMVEDGADGFLTEPDAQMLAERVLQLIRDDNLRAQMSLAAKETVQRISSGTCARQLADVYAELVNQKGNATAV